MIPTGFLPKRKLLHLGQALILAIALLFVIHLFVSPAMESKRNIEQRIAEKIVSDSRRKTASLTGSNFKTFRKYLEDLTWDFNTDEKMDWHDWERIMRDKARTGPGENGSSYQLDKNHDTAVESQLFNANGFNGMVSDAISINRSVKDIRHKDCSMKKYSSELPTVSVVIPFNNEHNSTLLRTFHSVINRSPPSLLKEIILVDDFSDKEHLKKPLETYLSKTPLVKDLVKLVRMPERGGLIRARQFGAKHARAEVIIFLDSHTEANYNWLPPLLEPIAENYRTVVCPFIDVIDMNNFEYRAQDEGARGAFDWQLYYKRLPLLPEDLKHPTRPFKSPVMAGGLFAISAKFFWELDGYDEGLQIWGGEQYELSFKIWMCGGKMYDAPCSRVGHVYRKFAPFSNSGFSNYLGHNYKRLAEIWMDEYKEYVYQRRPSYRHIDPGDISKQTQLKERLQCKPFKWFMEEIAFDLPLHYPPVEPDKYASGFIQNVAHPDFCLDARLREDRFKVAKCDGSRGQKFEMNWHKDLRSLSHVPSCLDVSIGGSRAPINAYDCHGAKGNQLWRYDLASQNLIHGANPRCLDMNTDTTEVYVTNCDAKSTSQRWIFEDVNEKRLSQWDLNKL